jgi:hypothetical protein
VVLAARGVCNLGGGETEVADPTLAAHLRRLGKRIGVGALAFALVLTALTWACPA